MKDIKRIMVGLDLSEMDKHLIRYASYLSNLIKPERVYFVHVERSLEFPAGMEAQLNIKKEPVDETIRKGMEKAVAKIFRNSRTSSCEVKEGSPLPELLHWSQIKNIDLILVGRKKDKDGTGIVAHKLARKATCPVMFVPESAKAIKAILVPLDMSDYSVLTLKEAEGLAKAVSAKVICQHVYNVPPLVHSSRRLGITAESVTKAMEQYAREAYNEFIGANTSGKPSLMLTKNTLGDYAEHIYRTAKKEKADLIVMGAKGKTGAEVVFFGSVTEKMIRINHDIPLLIIKKEKKNYLFG